MHTIIYYIILLSCFFTACAKKEAPTTDQIKKILFKGRYYDAKKEFNKALMEYQSLEKFVNTQAYKELEPEKTMEKVGWSADNLKGSFTIKIMTELQNKINKYIAEKGRFPNMMIPPYQVYDAWGKAIKLNTKIEDRHAKFFDYHLFSPGEDPDTDIDDIAIYNKSLNKFIKNDKSEKKETKQAKDDSEQMLDLAQMIELKQKEKKPL